jgi:hypothetical protein
MAQDPDDEGGGPVIDMTPEGEFVDPPRPSLVTILLRLALFGVFLAIIGAAIWVALWTALLLLPFVLIAALVVYFVVRPRFYRF